MVQVRAVVGKEFPLQRFREAQNIGGISLDRMTATTGCLPSPAVGLSIARYSNIEVIVTALVQAAVEAG